MIFDKPTPFSEALASHKASLLLPDGTDTGKVADEFQARAVTLARVTNAQFLAAVDKAVEKILAGDIGENEARRELQAVLQKISYEPPTGKEGTIQDLGSDARLNLIVRMQTEMAFGYGQWKQGQTAGALAVWPAQEFYRAEWRKEPRDWPARWQAAGGKFSEGVGDYPQGRMVAMKDDPIWTRISAFGLPYAPFDFNSGMDIRDVTRDEAVQLGVMSNWQTDPKPQKRDFAKDFEAGAKSMDTALQDALDESLGDGYSLKDGIVVPNEQRIQALEKFIANVGTSAGVRKEWETRDHGRGGEHAPEAYGLTSAKGTLGRMGYLQSNDPAVRVSVQADKGALFVTRLDAVEQGKGAGGKALERIKAYAAATGRRVELTAGADTPELQSRLNAFYEKHGFTKLDGDSHPSYVWHPPKQAANEARNIIERHGLKIHVENAAGTRRSGSSKNGDWTVIVQNDYGEILRTEGADGDAVDVTVGIEPSDVVYIVDQCNPSTKQFDEHKCFMDFGSATDAKLAFLLCYPDGSGGERILYFHALPIEQFKAWLKLADMSKPAEGFLCH